MIAAAALRKKQQDTVRERRKQAEDFANKGDTARAVEVLRTLCRDYPDETGPRDDLQKLEARIEVEFVNQTLAAVADRQTHGQWAQGLQEIEAALTRYPRNAALLTALEPARAAVLDEQRRAEIARLAQEIEAAIQARNWALAASKYGEAKARFPDEKVLDQLSKRLRRLQSLAEFEEFRASVQECFAKGDLKSADHLISGARRRFSSVEGWQELDHELNHRKAYERILIEAEAARRKGNYEAAQSALRQALSDAPPDTRAASLLQQIIAERRAHEMQACVTKALADAERLVRQARIPEALGLLDRACQDYPDHMELAARRSELAAQHERDKQQSQRRDEERRKATERARKIGSYRTAIEEALADRNWAGGRKALDAAQEEFPDEPGLVALRDRLVGEAKSEELDRVRTAVSASFASNDLAEAARQIAAAPPEYSQEPVLQALRDELDSRVRYSRCIGQAEEAFALGDTARSEELLREAMALGSDDRAVALLQDISAGPRRRRLRILIRFFRRHRRLIVALLLIMGVSWLVYKLLPFRQDSSPKRVDLKPNPAILTFVARAGGRDPSPQMVQWNAAGIPFHAFVTVPWLSISPDSGESLDRCLAKAFCPVERYGMKASSHWRITDITVTPAKTAWKLHRSGKEWAHLEFPLAGEYNVLNGTAAAALAANYGITAAEIAAALKTFKSVKRRLEVKAVVNGITIVDDFAHHPTAISGTLAALRGRYPGSRLWVILEPRSNTLRRRVLQDDLAQSLSGADEIVVAQVFKMDAIPEEERLDVNTLAAQISQSGRRVQVLEDADRIVDAVVPDLHSGDVVAILSNGGFGGIYEKLPRRLRESALASAQSAGARGTGAEK